MNTNALRRELEELRMDITRINKQEVIEWTDEEREIIKEYAQSLVKPDKPVLVHCTEYQTPLSEVYHEKFKRYQN